MRCGCRNRCIHGSIPDKGYRCNCLQTTGPPHDREIRWISPESFPWNPSFSPRNLLPQSCQSARAGTKSGSSFFQRRRAKYTGAPQGNSQSLKKTTGRPEGVCDNQKGLQSRSASAIGGSFFPRPRVVSDRRLFWGQACSFVSGQCPLGGPGSVLSANQKVLPTPSSLSTP